MESLVAIASVGVRDSLCTWVSVVVPVFSKFLKGKQDQERQICVFGNFGVSKSVRSHLMK